MILFDDGSWPTPRCQNCVLWSPYPEKNHCKRFIYPDVLIPVRSCLSCDVCVGTHLICKDFIPAPRCVDLCKRWTGFDDYFKLDESVYRWNKMMALWVNGDTDTRYCVPFESFIDGTMAQDGILHYAKSYFISKIGCRSKHNGLILHSVCYNNTPGTIVLREPALIAKPIYHNETREHS